MSMTRSHFHQSSLSSSLFIFAGAAAAHAAAEFRTNIDVHLPLGLTYGAVDAHVHIVETGNKIDYLWAKPPAELGLRCPCKPPCMCNWTLATGGEFESATEGVFGTHGVEYGVFCEVDANETQWLQEATWVQNGGGQGGLTKIGAIIAQPPPGFGLVPPSEYAKQLDELQALPLARGVRPPGWFGSLDPELPPNTTVLDSLLELGKRGMLVDLNINVMTGLALTLAQSAPSTKFVIEHMGGADDYFEITTANRETFAAWNTSIRELAKQKNVVGFQLGGVVHSFGNLSSLNAHISTIEPWVVAAVAAFGYDRIVFEGNWFFCNFGPPFESAYASWARTAHSLLQKHGASPTEIRKVLRDNAISIYGIAV